MTSTALWVVAVCLVAGAGQVVGQSAAVSLYREGNDLYRKGQYEQARQTYLAAADTGVRDARLFYNLGNACFKAKRLGEAIVWYERALRLEPRDDDIRANLAFVRHVKQDREPADDSPAVWRFFVRLHEYPTLDELAGAVGLLWLASFALGGWRLWSGSKSRGLTTALVTCALLTAAGAGWLGRRALDADVEEAVVTVEQATARSAPEEAETVIFTIHEGTKVTVERRESGWLLVRLANGLGGWLQAGDLTVI